MVAGPERVRAAPHERTQMLAVPRLPPGGVIREGVRGHQALRFLRKPRVCPPLVPTRLRCAPLAGPLPATPLRRMCGCCQPPTSVLRVASAPRRPLRHCTIILRAVVAPAGSTPVACKVYMQHPIRRSIARGSKQQQSNGERPDQPHAPLRRTRWQTPAASAAASAVLPCHHLQRAAVSGCTPFLHSCCCYLGPTFCPLLAAN